MDVMQILRIILGSIFVLLLPGLVWSYVFFTSKQIDFLERAALSFALSIAIVPLAAFYLNLAGVRISTRNVIVEVLGLVVLGLCGFGIKSYFHERSAR